MIVTTIAVGINVKTSTVNFMSLTLLFTILVSIVPPFCILAPENKLPLKSRFLQQKTNIWSNKIACICEYTQENLSSN